MQQSIIHQYLQLRGRPTLKVMVEDTGIQMTRIFRLLNGSIMKVDEYQSFQEKIHELQGHRGDLPLLALKCSSVLSVRALKILQGNMEHYLELHNRVHKREKTFQTTGALT